MVRITHEEFVARVKEKYGDNISILGRYETATKPILIRHNNCSHEKGYYEWYSTPHNLMIRNRKCPYCTHQSIEFKSKKKSKNPNIVMIGKYVNAITPTSYLCKKCNNVFDMLPSCQRKSNNCPYCTNRRTLKGLNDISTTHKEVFDLMKDKEFGYTHKYYTKEKTIFICPRCNNEVFNMPSLVINKNGNFICPFCSDGFSYPEKYFSSVLNQLGIEYVYQLTKKKLNWCKNYRYDFYIPDKKMIIETHGMQHYTNTTWATLDKISKNDEDKKNLAFENGIENYVIIDSRYSTSEYMKESILGSVFSKIYDLSKIDWDRCGIDASSSKMLEVCREWNNKTDTMVEFSKKFNLDLSTISDYLEKGAKLNICDFDRKEYNKNKKRKNAKPVYCHELNKTFNSIKEAQIQCNAKSISNACKNPHLTSGGYHWSYI